MIRASARVEPSTADAYERAMALMAALNAADRVVDAINPSLKRALTYERRPLDRQPRIVRQEVEFSYRLALDLMGQLERALAALPPEGGL